MKNKFKLTREEKEIEKSLDSGKWVDAPDALKQEIVHAAQQGVTSRKREARVNIRLRQETVELIRRRAEEEGLGYQTLMSSILHKYAMGRLVEQNVVSASRGQTQGKKKAV